MDKEMRKFADEVIKYLCEHYDKVINSEDLIDEICEENLTEFLGKEENHDKVIILQRDPDDDEYVSMLAVITSENELIKLFVDGPRVTEEKLNMILDEIRNVNYDGKERVSAWEALKSS